jgi:Alternative complex III, ActD subunit
MASKTKEGIHGVIAEFDGPEELVAAAERAYAEGYRQMDAYTPFPVHGLADAIGHRGKHLPLIVLAGGLVGGLGGFLMQAYATVINYPINVGGRPFFSWPAYVPITFELTVLGAVIAAVFGMLILNGLPQPYHPVFNVPNFELASRSHFFLCIESRDPQFDRAGTARFLESLAPQSVAEVPF